MTGIELAKQLCPMVCLAERDYYDWGRKIVFLRRSVMDGSGPFHLLVAAHECAHHEQNTRWPWLRWAQNIWPVLLVIEIHAWLLAIETMSG